MFPNTTVSNDLYILGPVKQSLALKTEGSTPLTQKSNSGTNSVSDNFSSHLHNLFLAWEDGIILSCPCAAL
jgi:hypothetical protein